MNAAEIASALQARERWLLTSHARPDGDAMGSLLALRLALSALGKKADVLLRESVPQVYGYLPGASTVTSCAQLTPELAAAYDGVVLLECGGFARTHIGGVERLFSINIDHHVSANCFASVNWIDPQACATAEMVYRVIHALGTPVTADIATCVYTGIVADTGCFVFSNTTPRTLEVAAELARLGAQPHSIAASIYLGCAEAKMRVLGAALANLKVEPPLAWMYVAEGDFAATGALEEDAEGLVNYALGIRGVELAAFFRPAADGGTRVSLRSKTDLSICGLAESFGGGGHHQASGCRIDAPLEQALQQVLPRLRALACSGSHNGRH